MPPKKAAAKKGKSTPKKKGGKKLAGSKSKEALSETPVPVAAPVPDNKPNASN